MRGLGIPALTFVLSACAADAKQGPPPPTTCDPATQRLGSYLMTFTRHGGTCGPQDPQLISLNPGALEGTGTQCTVTSEMLSEGGCKLERSSICTVARAQGDVTTYGAFITRQMTQDGALLTGTMTIRVDAKDGACQGTYLISATRQ